MTRHDKLTFQQVAKMILVRRCYNSGESIRAIAVATAVSPSTIRRWLRTTGLYGSLPDRKGKVRRKHDA